MNEDILADKLLTSKTERTSTDKLLAKEDVKRMVELSRQDTLTRGDIQELLSLCISTESKLVNFSDWDRYYVLKIFVWLRQIINRALHVYDYKAILEYKEKMGEIKINESTHAIMERNRRMAEYNAKFMIDLYLNICRTSLSVGGSAFIELLKNRHEIEYNVRQPSQVQPEKKSIFG